ncbi:hypothetical protein B0J13DRAFT_543543 [Dactylonectria estremocensis]|uniref:Uncharacterized protein n=1 Tax=Dactylonectria estremocensis TaxID=1079267 RepID=A0A9P9FE02_9HYPO|nr:hypothetical protein B0J13DRAFT_543543 [Dactylonectria estremocensis]
MRQGGWLAVLRALHSIGLIPMYGWVQCWMDGRVQGNRTWIPLRKGAWPYAVLYSLRLREAAIIIIAARRRRRRRRRGMNGNGDEGSRVKTTKPTRRKASKDSGD